VIQAHRIKRWAYLFNSPAGRNYLGLLGRPPRLPFPDLATRLTGPPGHLSPGSPGRLGYLRLVAGRPGHHLPGTPLTLPGTPRLTTGEHATHSAARQAWRADLATTCHRATWLTG